MSTPFDWQQVYETEVVPGWDMGQPAPGLAEVLAAVREAGETLGPRVLVPACGWGHDAAAFAAMGHPVVGLDIAPAAVAGARERYGEACTWVLDDLFHTDLGAFDALFDHACFIAMPIARRGEYRDALARHLRPGGLWLGIFQHSVTYLEGPPFAVQMEELRTLAEPAFEVLALRPCETGHPRRLGREFLMVAKRRQG